MYRFPLLRLPFVALIEVLKSLNPIELVLLAPCSRKMARMIPLAGTKKISLAIDFDDLKIVMNTNYALQFRNELYDLDGEPNTLVYDFLNDSYTEIVDRLFISGVYISGLFECPIKSLEFGQCVQSWQCRSIIEEVLTTQHTPLENLGADVRNEDFKWLMKNANVTGRFFISTYQIERLSVVLKLNCRQFHADPANWVTVDSLVSLTSCVTIKLDKTRFTYQDLDVFMKKWKSGLLPNLEYLMVNSYCLVDDGQILGFSENQLSAEKGVRRERMVDNEYFATCRRGVDVENDDGMKGSIQIRNRSFELFVWKN